MRFAQESGGVAFIRIEKKVRNVRALHHPEGTFETQIHEITTIPDVGPL